MDGRTGSITVTAMVGTGLATLALSLTGVAGLSGDLHAAALKAKGTTPVLTPGEELDTAAHDRALVLRDACAHSTLRHHHTPGSDDPVSTTPAAPAATTPSRQF